MFEATTPSMVTLEQLSNVISFELPCELEASEPPEARGLRRDDVRLMVSYQATDMVEHTNFRHISDYLEAGDVLVINTSKTMNAALSATRTHDKQAFEVHLSTQLPANLWIIELRQPDTDKNSTLPFYSAKSGDRFEVSGGGMVTLLTPHQSNLRDSAGNVRLWIATINLPEPTDMPSYLATYGFPIRYSYVKDEWPNQYYQTIYGTEFGSAEMPSAGRAFTSEIITLLVAKGVQILPLILHTGVASLEEHEPPYEEYYRVPVETARTITQARQNGQRVVAVGTTVVRALETVTASNGVTYPGAGWTEVVITPQRGIHAVNGILTGLHEPKATHLAMLQALTGIDHLKVTYGAALEQRYLWHEFGDLHLILP